MNLRLKTVRSLYQSIAKPLFFLEDPESSHDHATKMGEFISSYSIGKKALSTVLAYQNDGFLSQDFMGITFQNPVGLAAGFDYDGHLANTMKHAGFGYNTVGTVTAKSYEGNPPPRLERLIKSKSLLVNKGFKSEGAEKIMDRLESKDLGQNNIGISVGSSNLPDINTIPKAIDDYLYTFRKFKNKSYVSYFELNISCPNTSMTEGFGQSANLLELLKEVESLKIKKPIFLKMANELTLNKADKLMNMAIKHRISGLILSNLVKNRTNPFLLPEELSRVKSLKGNFSGLPTRSNSDMLIKHAHKEYGKYAIIIGCGGVFTPQDAYRKVKNGASLVQLITGMIYEGPQIAGEINTGLVDLLKKDGFSNISEAVGIED